MNTIEIQPLAQEVMRRLSNEGHEVYLAGGSVRDAIMGRPSKDIDIVTSATPDIVQELFPHHVPDGKEHGIVKAIFDSNVVVDIATMRTDGEYTDGRRPDFVKFTKSIEEDVLRRDFTMNGLIAKPTGEVIDLVNGLADIESRTVRAIGNPVQRFIEDKLRMLRAIRFGAKLDFQLDPITYNAIVSNATLLDCVSKERIWFELWEILRAKTAYAAIGLLICSGLMEFIFPEVLNCHAIKQDEEHHPEGDVLTHTLEVVRTLSFMRTSEGALMENPTLLLAGLLHDIGKAKTTSARLKDRQWRISHIDHERVGEEMAEEALRRITCPTAIRDKVCWLVRNHMRAHKVKDMKKSKLVSFLREAKKADCINEMVSLQYADAMSSGHHDKSNFDFFLEVLKEPITDEIIAAPLLLNGLDIMALGVPQGKKIGEILNRIRELQDAGEITTKLEAFVVARSWVDSLK